MRIDQVTVKVRQIVTIATASLIVASCSSAAPEEVAAVGRADAVGWWTDAYEPPVRHPGGGFGYSILETRRVLLEEEKVGERTWCFRFRSEQRVGFDERMEPWSSQSGDDGHCYFFDRVENEVVGFSIPNRQLERLRREDALPQWMP